MLLNNINFTLCHADKIALVGHNGSGKSTLLSLIMQSIAPTSGEIKMDTLPYLVPQVFGQFNDLTVAEAVRVDKKIMALQQILNGQANEFHFDILDDDWGIENRIEEAFKHWQLHGISLSQKMGTLSGGQQTRIFLSGILIHQPEFVLLDEPSNHLDTPARNILYTFLSNTSTTIIVVSHDRKLLNLFHKVAELSKSSIQLYHGNYEYYLAEKTRERDALTAEIYHKEKDFKKARDKERETSERQQKLDARGKRKQEKAGVARIMMNTLRNNAEKSTSKLKDVHAEKIGTLSSELRGLRSEISEIDQMKFGFNNAQLHQGKVLFKLKDVNFCYRNQLIWENDLNLQILSGERVALNGPNGSGKTTLVLLLLGKLTPTHGTSFNASANTIMVDQNYSLINNHLSVYLQTQQFNTAALHEHEVKTRLAQFLFKQNDWDKPCIALSGGERMRLLLCCLNVSAQTPDVMVLDEPTNNLDLQNIEMLTKAVKAYRGTLIIISHDQYFLKEVDIQRSIELKNRRLG